MGVTGLDHLLLGVDLLLLKECFIGFIGKVLFVLSQLKGGLVDIPPDIGEIGLFKHLPAQFCYVQLCKHVSCFFGAVLDHSGD